MADNFVSDRNLRFLLYGVFNTSVFTKGPYFEEHNQKIFDIVLETAIKLGKDFLSPALQKMDKNPPEFVKEWRPFIQNMRKKAALKEDYALNYSMGIFWFNVYGELVKLAVKKVRPSTANIYQIMSPISRWVKKRG